MKKYVEKSENHGEGKLKFFKNKFFICLLCISLAICIFGTVFSIMGVGNTVKRIVGDMLSPMEEGITNIKKSLEGYALYFSGMNNLIDENQELKDEIDKLKEKLYSANLAEEENQRLRDYISVKEEHGDFELTEALIIGTQSENYTSFVKINKGTDNGIAVNMPVIVSGGLVGCVSEVGSNWAFVRIICEASAGVGGYISRSGEIGVVVGDITYSASGVCKLKYLDIDADIEIGDAVYTSGTGSVYPGGLLIGHVSSIGIDEYSRSKTATVTCAVDFKNLNYVMVVTGFEMKSVVGEGDE